uniref:GalKase_gal_bdg domain-containing protein n=1 Tax=Heterorhabditis bacteriophora TaxID=37862 RepID=A0A1I7XUB3_HETBA
MAHFSIGDGLNQKDVCENETQLLPEPEYITNLKRVVVREAYELFLSHFGVEQSKELRAAVAPGRVNLIGEHIDYCDGFVLPMVRAIPLYTAVLGRQVKDQSRGYSLIFSSHFNQTVEIKKPYEQRCDKVVHNLNTARFKCFCIHQFSILINFSRYLLQILI